MSAPTARLPESAVEVTGKGAARFPVTGGAAALRSAPAVVLLCGLAALAGCTSAVRDVPVTPLAGQSEEQRGKDGAECDAWARKAADYQPVRPAGDNVRRGRATLPANEVVREDAGVGGAFRQNGFLGGKLGIAFGGPDRDAYVRMYGDCMTRRGYRAAPKETR